VQLSLQATRSDFWNPTIPTSTAFPASPDSRQLSLLLESNKWDQKRSIFQIRWVNIADVEKVQDKTIPLINSKKEKKDESKSKGQSKGQRKGQSLSEAGELPVYRKPPGLEQISSESRLGNQISTCRASDRCNIGYKKGLKNLKYVQQNPERYFLVHENPNPVLYTLEKTTLGNDWPYSDDSKQIRRGLYLAYVQDGVNTLQAYYGFVRGNNVNIELFNEQALNKQEKLLDDELSRRFSELSKN